jgi:hypothetical protein
VDIIYITTPHNTHYGFMKKALETAINSGDEKLHAKEHLDKDYSSDRRTKEVEAESIAYTICQHYGLDSSDYSFSYVAGWSSGKETKELKASLERIRSAADEMITDIDKSLEKQVKREQNHGHREEAR